jgi:hypothetical protein
MDGVERAMESTVWQAQLDNVRKVALVHARRSLALAAGHLATTVIGMTVSAF